MPVARQYNREKVIARILERVSNGMSLRQACSPSDVPSRNTFSKWKREDPDLRQRWKDAQIEGYEVLQDQMSDEWRDIEKELRDSNADPKDKRLWLEARKLRMDSLKWELSKRISHIYGDKFKVTNDDGDSVPAIVLTKEFRSE
jgi:hypothetical protein